MVRRPRDRLNPTAKEPRTFWVRRFHHTARVDTRRMQKHRGLSRPRYTPVNEPHYSHELQSLNSGAVRWQSNLESNSERAATTLSTVPTRAKHPSSSTGTTLILPAAETSCIRRARQGRIGRRPWQRYFPHPPRHRRV